MDRDVLTRALSSLRSDARASRMGEKIGGKPKLVLSISVGEPDGDEPPSDPVGSLEEPTDDFCPECGMSGGEHAPDCSMGGEGGY
jgi:hypothetical protein